MAYNPSIGLIAVGGVSIPIRFMKAETYIATRSITDLDSYRDANGVLHRNALEHEIYKIEFNTPPLMTNKDIKEFMDICKNAYTIPKERKLTMTAYIPELDDYITQDAYMPDANFTIYWVNGSEIKYNAVRVAFIGY